jgi:hypothetical protein
VCFQLNVKYRANKEGNKGELTTKEAAGKII